VLITLLGWLVLIGGAVRLFDPPQLAAIGRSMLASAHGLQIAAAIWLVIGAVLCFFGYIH
jgi:hypothetical protein